MPEQFLAIADADKIHDYVFSPHELRLIKGGSFLQSSLNTWELKRTAYWCGGRWISANGGTVVAKFHTQVQADNFCREAGYFCPSPRKGKILHTHSIE